MNMKKTFLTAATAGLVALGGAAVADKAEAGSDKEKCYGVVKAGANDCAGKGYSCAGHSTVDSDGSAFIVLPKGLCERLANGSTEAK